MGTIYQILNMETQHFYIGSAVRHERRWWEHRKQLRTNTHHCAALQAAWNKYGEDAFVFEVLEECDDNTIRQIEDTYLLKHAGQPHCYNTLTSAVNSPMDFAEYRKKVSDSMKALYANPNTVHPRLGKAHSEETKRLISKSRKGKGGGEQHYMWGKTQPEEVRKKIGEAQRGKRKAPRVISEEGMAKIRAAAERGAYSHWKGRSHTEESKLKMSKRVREITYGLEFDSLTAALQHYGMTMPTLRRALVTDKPLAKGKFIGLHFRYVEKEDAPEERNLVQGDRTEHQD